MSETKEFIHSFFRMGNDRNRSWIKSIFSESFPYFTCFTQSNTRICRCKIIRSQVFYRWNSKEFPIFVGVFKKPWKSLCKCLIEIESNMSMSDKYILWKHGWRLIYFESLIFRISIRTSETSYHCGSQSIWICSSGKSQIIPLQPSTRWAWAFSLHS